LSAAELFCQSLYNVIRFVLRQWNRTEQWPVFTGLL